MLTLNYVLMGSQVSNCIYQCYLHEYSTVFTIIINSDTDLHYLSANRVFF